MHLSVRWRNLKRVMISSILPLIMLCVHTIKKSLLMIIFGPIIVWDLWFSYIIQSVIELFNDIILKPFNNVFPEEIEAHNPEEIRRGKVFIDKLMGYWRDRPVVIKVEELLKLECLGLFYGVRIDYCRATVSPSFTREGNCLLTEENGRIRIKARLNDGDIVLEAPILFNFMNYEIRVDSYVRIHRITAYVEFDFDGRTRKNGNLIDIEIEGIKYFFVHFRGGNFLHYVLSIAASRFMYINYYVTRNFVQTSVKKYLTLNFNKLEFFVHTDKSLPTSDGHNSDSEATLTSSETEHE